MVCGSGVRQVSRFVLCGFSGFRRTVFKAEAIVSGFEDVAAMSKAVKKRRGHLRVAKDGCPFAEAEVGRDDDAGSFIELAQKVEE